MTQQIIVNGNTYSDDGTVGKGMGDGAFRENLLPMLGDTIVDVAGRVAEAANQAAIAAQQAAIALGAAASTVTGPGSTGTSTTNLTVSRGQKNLTIQPNKTLYPGMPIAIAASASPCDVMYGPLISYNASTGATVVYVTNISTTAPGTYISAADWVISLTGPAGVTGLLNENEGAPLASGSAIDLDNVTGNFLHLTGSAGPINTVILAQGAERVVVLDGAPTFAHSTSLILPTGANVVGAPGDVVTLRGEGSGVTRVTNWGRASGRALAAVPPGVVKVAGPLTPAAAAALDLVGLFTGAHDNYLIIGSGIRAANSDGHTLNMRASTAGVIDAAARYLSAPANGSSNSVSPSMGIGSINNNDTQGINFEIRVSNSNSAAGLKTFSVEGFSQFSGPNTIRSVSNRCAYTGGAIDGFSLFWNTGVNFAAVGEIYIYGYGKI